ncbi:MAG: alpha-1,4-glucan--maltose-1-phosphate maltosyltransferase [Thermoleophilia bacterium]|nr:alpha-1,4-glucan--maltose-1-phosphate maltosyltransferase [Thermoleophilia bacterium]
MPVVLPKRPPARIQITSVEPTLDCGRHPVKRTQGDRLAVSAVVFRDGHEELRAAVVHRAPSGEEREVPMRREGGPDEWRAEVALEELGRHRVRVVAWTAPFASWREEMRRKVDGGQPDLTSELAEGAVLLAAIAPGLDEAARTLADGLLATLADPTRPQGERVAAGLAGDLAEAVERHPERPERTESGALEVDVDRELATFGAWYELFPRSFGGLRGVAGQIPRLAELGFDVVYLPPIHPIGVTHRKGRNNAPTAEPGDVGSPWAIGGDGGGHTAVHAELGTMEDLSHLVATAREHGVEIALDFAIQCSPDHPWLSEHPDWFHRRPDGTLKYAENPPKRYQDIYNINFDSPDWRALWRALRDVVMFWVRAGIRVFRVDNPHTKPVAFWEWLIREVRDRHPDVVFLSEAFTGPPMMRQLAKAGFSQSYTYFTWKNTKAEIGEWIAEWWEPGTLEYLRPNLFANTPDILHAYLQQGGPGAFAVRLVLAATLSPSYGIYSGFEHHEGTPVREGSEEYLDSEKYQVRERDLDGPLMPLVWRLNAIRRAQPALRRTRGLRVLDTVNDHLFAFLRGSGAGAVLVVVNLDPGAPQEGLVVVPPDAGLPARFTAHDMLSGESWTWSHGPNYVRLDPAVAPAHVLGCTP